VERISIAAETRSPSGRTNAYVVGTDPAVLIDPAGQSARLDDALADRSLAHVIVTHHHADHVGGVPTYADDHDATVWARLGRDDSFEAATGVVADRFFSDGTTIPTDDGHVRIVDTPGHAPEHVAVVTDEGICCGDLVVESGSVVVGAPSGDMRAYCSSLRRMIARDPPRLYPSHGPVITSPVATCKRLLAHRLDRERRVRSAVADGATAVAEITDSAYDKDVSHVRDLAEATVRAHLEKLSVEGRVDWDGRRADPAGDE